MPVGIGNVWTHPLVPVTSRLICSDGSYHPTEKPLLFADRIIRASSRPGDRILSVFSGTCREAVANHRLQPEEARHVTSIEMNRLYLDAVRGCFELDTTPKNPTQQGLFA
jgi:DNA modification methylase